MRGGKDIVPRKVITNANYPKFNIYLRYQVITGRQMHSFEVAIKEVLFY